MASTGRKFENQQGQLPELGQNFFITTPFKHNYDWGAIRVVSAVDNPLDFLDALNSDTAKDTAIQAGIIIELRNRDSLIVEISQFPPNSGNLPALTATGALTNITDWSGELWLARSANSGPQENLGINLWAPNPSAIFPNQGSRPFFERFVVGGADYAAFFIYGFAGAGSFVLTMRGL